MPQVLLVNPAPRPSKRKATTRKGKPVMAKKQRTAAQKAATRRMIAANRAKRKSSAPKRPRRAARVSQAKPAAKRRTRRSHPITPASVATRAGRQLRYRRKNPIGGVGEFMTNTLVPSAIGGAGALALDVVMGMLPLPPAMKSGPFAPVVKVAGAVALGMGAGLVVKRRMAEQFAAGAITVTLYNVAKGLLVKMGGGKIPGLAAYPDDGMAEYVGEYVGPDAVPQLGYVDSGMQVGEYVGEADTVEGYETGVYR